MRLLSRIIFLLICVLPTSVRAQTTLYWDTDGANPGLAQGDGSWNAAHWSTSASGNIATGSWVNGSIAGFSPDYGVAVSVDSDVTVGGIDVPAYHGLTLSGAGILTFAPGSEVHNNSAIDFDIVLAGSAASGTTAFTLTGTYDTNFTRANTFNGQLLINGGDVTINNAAAFGTSGAGNETHFTNGGGQFLSITAPMTLNEGLIFTGYRYVRVPDASVVNLAGPIVLDGGGNLGMWTGDNLTISGNISETNGAATFVPYATLSGTNTFTGVLEAGRLTVATFNNAGVAGPLGMSASLQLGYNYEGQTDGSVRYTGATATSDRAIGLYGETNTVEVTNPATTLTLTGVISDASGSATNPDFAKAGEGKLVLQGANTFTGDTLVVNGTLSLGSGQAVGSSSGAVVELGTSNTGASDNLSLLLQNNVTLNREVYVNNYNTDGGTATLGLDGSGTATFGDDIYIEHNTRVAVPTGGTLNFDGLFSDDGSGGYIQKTGAGRAIFNGGIDLQAGSLVVIQGEAVLNNPGSGNVILGGGAYVNTGATLNLGMTTAGTLTVSNFSLSGGNLQWKLTGLSKADPTKFDHVITATGTVEEGDNENALAIAPGSTLTVDLSLLGISSRPTNGTAALNDPFWQAYQFWDIIAFTGNGVNNLTPGTLDPLTVVNGFWAGGKFDTLVGGGAGEFSALNAGDVYLRFTPVPEPSTYALLGAGLTLLGLRRLRRQA